ncbi:MAG: DUF3987 domain-containing protein [Methylobacterium sp.]|nr:DUF3987 domain-containing protein [Methylobacterium sp.]MCA3670093.1 DUF3987 domain-containing protein [Methylobacterium sp.]MCA3675078.1 DUF3987 domain-containing protein [Methylobacterium sp.]MCA3678649.1 DUF3987 domain-containing protein [Methylobacterium sp.]MCA3682318.1 DUF3987 domain-containing protein [Methylobacterium sp.]
MPQDGIDLNPGDPFGVFGRNAEAETGREADETEAVELNGGSAPPVEPPPDSAPPNSPSPPDSASAPATGPPQAILDHALAWAARGFRIFPVQPGAKVPPKGMFWRNEATSDPAKIRAWWAFNPNYNYGVAGGDGWLIVDVDAGKNGFASLLDVDLPDTLTVKTPGGGLHLYYRGPDVANSVDRVAPGIDIRSKGGYVIGPGSVFDDADGAKGYRGAYKLIDDRPAADAPAGFLLQCGEPKQRDRAAAVSVDDPDDIVFAIHYLEKDAPAAVEGRGGNNTTYAVAARLIEIGVSGERAAELMAEHWNARCSPPWDVAELVTICGNAANYALARQGSGGVSALKDEAGAPVALPASEADTPPLFDPWREFIVPDVPTGILPDIIERFATGQSSIMGACRNALAMAAFAALSGAVDHRTSLRLMRNGEWTASPRLWTLLAGPPSSKKTPIMSAALAPLKRLEARRQKAWRDECARVPEGVQKPKQPERYLAGNTTTEALAAILARQDRGILVEHDEIAAWIGGMEKYNNGGGGAADRAFWLEAFNGASFSVDRVTRPSISVENLSASIIGGIQPARLAELQGLQSDGLLQRFIPAFVGPGRIAQDRAMPPDGYHEMIEQAASIAPMEFRFDDGALTVAEPFRQRTHDLQTATENALPGFAQFVGKLDGLFGTFCLLFHVAEGLEPGNWVMERISACTAARVERLFSDFLLPHAFEFYGVADHAVTDKLRKIASWILTQGSLRITARDLMREVSCLRGMDAWAIGRALGPLIAGGWLEPEKPGPDNRAWHVSPAVAFQFEQRREDEERRKQELARLMNGPRRAAGAP